MLSLLTAMNGLGFIAAVGVFFMLLPGLMLMAASVHSLVVHVRQLFTSSGQQAV